VKDKEALLRSHCQLPNDENHERDFRESVSRMTTATRTPEKNVSAPITPIAVELPNESANSPAASAPTA
jgi:hypothetical protein